MAEGKKSFVAYADWLDTFEALPDDKAGQLAKHLFRYVNDLEPISEDVLINAVFANIKHTLKRDLRKYDNYVDKQRENGKKGGRPKKEEKPKEPKPLFENPTEPKKADSVSVSVSVTDSVIKKQKIERPNFEEFKTYALEKEPLLDVTALKNKFEAWEVNGWKNGNDKKIVNWKSSLLNTIPHIKKVAPKKESINAKFEREREESKRTGIQRSILIDPRS